MKRIVCKYCGVEHDCAGRMSNHERAKLAAVGRAVKAEKRKQIVTGEQQVKKYPRYLKKAFQRCEIPLPSRGNAHWYDISSKILIDVKNPTPHKFTLKIEIAEGDK